MTKNAGKIFEENFSSSIDSKNSLVKRLNDNAASFSQGIGTRFTSTNECDFLVFNTKYQILFCLELKSTIGSLTFWRDDFTDKDKKVRQTYNIKKNQILGLKKWSKYKYTVCGFIFNFRNDNNETFFVSITDFLDYTNMLSKKSININDVKQMNPTKIESKILRTNYRYDVEDLFCKLSSFGEKLEVVSYD